MDVVLPMPGSYVVGVSGGVDSMALLDLLQRRNQERGQWKLTVAHLDHGMRADSSADRQLVQATARDYGLPFVYQQARLGLRASEAAARTARYQFLQAVQRASKAQAIITAHHQDDVLETAIINLLRGTGRKGLTSLSSRRGVLRPLLNVPKRELRQYAREQGLRWREDSTNQDETYLRNYVRQRLLSRFDEPGRQRLLQLITQLRNTNQQLDALLAELSDGQLARPWFNQLPHAVAREVLADWLRRQGITNFDRPTLERLVVAAKTGRSGQRFAVRNNQFLVIRDRELALDPAER